MPPEELRREVARRRTFAIIAHPDADKTTLIEKLLLYAGAITAAAHRRRLDGAGAGARDLDHLCRPAIRPRRIPLQPARHAGHQDFSADTHRTLLAADSAVMVPDGTRGIESQTRKLFAACHPRGLPIITFVNKLDREGCDPLALLDAIEGELGLRAVSLNWPIGGGTAFRGLYDLPADRLLLFSRSPHNLRPAPLRGDPPLPVGALRPAPQRRRREAETVPPGPQPAGR